MVPLCRGQRGWAGHPPGASAPDSTWKGHGTGLTSRAELAAYAGEYHAIVAVLTELGPDRVALLARLQEQNGGAVASDDTAETVDLFLAGVGR